MPARGSQQKTPNPERVGRSHLAAAEVSRMKIVRGLANRQASRPGGRRPAGRPVWPACARRLSA
ncbi:hypothetical protein PSAC2689_180074 [Paraburkholderia sacchari]